MVENQAKQFLKKIFQNLEGYKIDIKNWEIDHLCYRTSSQENYSEVKETFHNLGQLLIESEVNGRLIATYKLEKPIFYEKWIIDLIEVPAPKPNKETIEGFEHIEVVIDENFDELLDKYSNINFNKKGLSKDLNPELEIEFQDCAIKFHHKSLEHIINIEKNDKIATFLEEENILSKLKGHTPCISGTLPLDIQHMDSDLDILFQSENLDEFLNEAKTLFGNMSNFTHRMAEYQNLQSLIINFDYNDLPIELFCQNTNVFKQQANQHFLIEGRLLKLLGKEFSKKIRQLKVNGTKTEPAFGELLNLKEPYSDLIELNKLSDSELFSKFNSTSQNL